MASSANPISKNTIQVAKGVASLRAGQGNSFLLRRLHSLSGIIPIGAFLLEHFISNSEATKGALAALTRSWAAEFSPAGVRINTVVSGPVYTGIRPDSVTEAVGTTTLMARAAQPDEIASVIVFLASAQASYVTGTVFAADGGRTAI